MADTDSILPPTQGTTPNFASDVGVDASITPEIASPLGETDKPKASLAEAKQSVKEGAGKVQQQAVEKIQALAGDGKAKAGSALEQVARMLNDAADQVDERLGSQYGQYARSAADSVTSLSGAIKDKDVEELLDDARAFVTKSPAVAIGIAAALGFVLARVVQSGIETREPSDAKA